MDDPKWQELIDATIEKMNEEIPQLLSDNRKDILESITEKIDPDYADDAIDATFKIEAKLHIYDGKCDLNLSIGWSKSYKKTHPRVTIDLHPELGIKEGDESTEE